MDKTTSPAPGVYARLQKHQNLLRTMAHCDAPWVRDFDVQRLSADLDQIMTDLGELHQHARQLERSHRAFDTLCALVCNTTAPMDLMEGLPDLLFTTAENLGSHLVPLSRNI